jgi:formaldehyde-activating enzyme
MILASAQVVPEIWQQVYAAVQQGDLEAARNLQHSVQKLARIFCRHGGGVAVRAALNMMGVKVGRPRRPLKSVGGALLHEVRAEIQLELEKLGKIATRDATLAISQCPLLERFADLGLTADILQSIGARLGTGVAGDGVDRVQIDLVAGPKEGPVGEAYALQLTYPRHGFEALTTILEPALTVRPAALVVPAVELKNLRQANMIYGPTQSAVGRAIVDGLAAGSIPHQMWDSEVMLAQATVHPQALDRHKLYWNVYQAMNDALQNAYSGGH